MYYSKYLHKYVLCPFILNRNSMNVFKDVYNYNATTSTIVMNT